MARILIVDDDEQARRFIGGILEPTGHQILFAKNGEEAMRTYLRRGVDLMVTDLHMPSGDGLELIEAMTALGVDVPIIVVSGTGPSMLGMAKLIGARATLAKPVDPRELITAVTEALKGR